MIAFILKYITPRDYAIGGLVVVVIYLATMWHQSSVELKKAQLVYRNPEVKTVEKIVYKTGPVRIKTVVVKEVSGAEITTIEETHAPTTTETVNAAETTPVPLAVALKEPRADRYLLSVGLNRLTADVDGKALFVGYGFKNRLDIQVGGVEHDGWSPWVLATARF